MKWCHTANLIASAAVAGPRDCTSKASTLDSSPPPPCPPPHTHPPPQPDRGVDDLVHDTVVQLLQRKVLIACDRKYKKPKPGRTQLVKFPRTLEGVQVRAAV